MEEEKKSEGTVDTTESPNKPKKESVSVSQVTGDIDATAEDATPFPKPLS